MTFFRDVLFAVCEGCSCGMSMSAFLMDYGLIKQRQFESAYATLLPELNKTLSCVVLVLVMARFSLCVTGK